MLKKISIFVTLLIVVSFTQINCGRQYVSDSALSTTPSTNDDFKLKCEAYLFDAQLKRDGKPTSFRLDLYQLDTLIGIGGRGYLGKGALKGYMSADSLKVYFPASNEYVLEAITDLMNSFECTEKHPEFRLFELFFDLPDSIDFPTSINITSDYEDTNKPEFIVSTTNCPWRISLTYDNQEKGWRIRDFEFTDGNKTTLKAKRRIYKKETEIKSNKFVFYPASDAFRLIP